MNEVTILPSGKARELPERLLGLQAIAHYEHLIDDPVKVAITREMAPAYIRFPGGMVGNYYNWRTGQFEYDVQPDSNSVYRFFAQAGENIKRLHPQGIFIEPYYEFAQKIGAEIVLLVNLETSTVADQSAWFEQMKKEGILPRYLELGNEFWLAMLGDPNVMKKWTDVKTTMRVMKEYRDALQPYFVSGTKIAVQATGGRFYANVVNGKITARQGFQAWDSYLKSEPWFDAVTIHLYPEIDRIVGAGERAKLPANMDKVFPTVMARCDQGIDETLTALEKQLPGKEIWVTEWSGWSWGLQTTSGQLGLHVHLTTRMLMTFLRHSSVTITHYHMLNFSGGSMSLYRTDPQAGGYTPINSAMVLKWFNQAANGGAVYQPLKIDGTRRIMSAVTTDEGYNDLDAALFRRGEKATLIIHNAGAETKAVTLTKIMNGKLPVTIEMMYIDPATEYSQIAPPVEKKGVATMIEVPPHSLTRVIWE
jgi:hypothetical protein